MESVHHTATITPELAGQRLDQALAALFPDYSRSRIKEWILAGQVRLDGRVQAPRLRVTAGQSVEMTAIFETQVDSVAQPISLNVVHEDETVLVINKPAGLVVHPGAGNPTGTLVNGLLHHAPELAQLPRGGLLHRLDKDTTGLLLIAKTIAAHTQLIQDLQERRITREYRAVCGGRVTAGSKVDAPMGRHPVHRTRMAINDRGKPAVTHYRVLRRFDAHTLLALRLDTGRTHQIRVHMAHIGFPLVGDKTYGGRLKMPSGASTALQELLRSFRRQALHASRLAFTHPATGEIISLQSPLPKDFIELVQALDGTQAGTEAHYNALVWPEPIK